MDILNTIAAAVSVNNECKSIEVSASVLHQLTAYTDKLVYFDENFKKSEPYDYCGRIYGKSIILSKSLTEGFRLLY